MLNNWRGVDLPELAGESIDETAGEYAALNAEQMYEGELNDGSPIMPPYAPSTVKRKIRKGQPYDRVTLRDKGYFHEELELKREEEDLTMDSAVEYEKYIVEKYTKKIYFLDDQNNVKYVTEIFRPILEQKITDLTGLKFG